MHVWLRQHKEKIDQRVKDELSTPIVMKWHHEKKGWE